MVLTVFSEYTASLMSIARTFNNACPTAWMKVDLPVRAAGPMARRGVRGSVGAAGPVRIAVRDGAERGIRAIGRGIQRTVPGTGAESALSPGLWGQLS